MTFELSLFEWNGSLEATTGGVPYEKRFFSAFRKILKRTYCIENLRETASDTCYYCL